MNLINRYRIIIAVILPFLILLLIRTCSTGSFKYDARKWAEPSFSSSNVISKTDIGKLSGEKLIINLEANNNTISEKSVVELKIAPDSVLTRKYLKKIRDHEGPVLLASPDPAMAARLWMVISQTGCRNLYILTTDNDNEVFKNEFRPDTIVRPEL
jgi:hypothetical protein